MSGDGRQSSLSRQSGRGREERQTSMQAELPPSNVVGL